MNGNAVRINVSLPFELVKDLKRYSKPRELSKFLAVAAEEKITRDRREKALGELMAAPPAFTDIKDSVKWVRKLRHENLKRLRRLGI
ncbi:MAG: hypothetical protein Q8Q91_02340 [Candidatus Daviesbacteria bacterium]|nr:hypothetical protein [Candidatus Daviesbacteria bacterium]